MAKNTVKWIANLQEPRKPKPHLREKDWAPYKDFILQLRDDGKTTTEQIRDAVVKEFGFVASIPQYKKILGEWRPKHLNKAQRRYIIYTSAKRRGDAQFRQPQFRISAKGRKPRKNGKEPAREASVADVVPYISREKAEEIVKRYGASEVFSPTAIVSPAGLSVIATPMDCTMEDADDVEEYTDIEAMEAEGEIEIPKGRFGTERTGDLFENKLHQELASLEGTGNNETDGDSVLSSNEGPIQQDGHGDDIGEVDTVMQVPPNPPGTGERSKSGPMESQAVPNIPPPRHLSDTQVAALAEGVIAKLGIELDNLDAEAQDTTGNEVQSFEQWEKEYEARVVGDEASSENELTPATTGHHSRFHAGKVRVSEGDNDGSPHFVDSDKDPGNHVTAQDEEDIQDSYRRRQEAERYLENNMLETALDVAVKGLTVWGRIRDPVRFRELGWQEFMKCCRDISVSGVIRATFWQLYVANEHNLGRLSRETNIALLWHANTLHNLSKEIEAEREYDYLIKQVESVPCWEDDEILRHCWKESNRRIADYHFFRGDDAGQEMILRRMLGRERLSRNQVILMTFIARTLRNRGKLWEAKKYCALSWKRARQLEAVSRYGPQIKSISALVDILVDENRSSEAIRILERAILPSLRAWSGSADSEDDKFQLAEMLRITGLQYHDLGRYDEALEYLTCAVQMRAEVKNANYSGLLRSIRSISITLELRGMVFYAYPLLRFVMQKYEEFMGRDNQWTLDAILECGNMLIKYPIRRPKCIEQSTATPNGSCMS